MVPPRNLQQDLEEEEEVDQQQPEVQFEENNAALPAIMEDQVPVIQHQAEGLVANLQQQ